MIMEDDMTKLVIDRDDARLIYKFKLLQDVALVADEALSDVPANASEGDWIERNVDAVWHLAAKLQTDVLYCPPVTDAGREIARRIAAYIDDGDFGLILNGQPRGWTSTPAKSADFLDVDGGALADLM
jgi:hypothetical protein